MITLSSYQNLIEKIGLAKLDQANTDSYHIVKEGSANFSDPNLWNEMLADADIREAYELHVKALQNMATSSSPSPKTSKQKPGKVAIKKTVPVKSRKTKPNPKLKSIEVAQQKKKKAKRLPKKPAKVAKTKVVKAETKFPLTMKRFSKELQLIKRFAALDGKQKSISSLHSFHKSTGKTLKENPDHKSLIKEIFSRLKEALSKAEDHRLTHIDVILDKTFKERLVKTFSAARPKVKLEYFAGLPSQTEPSEKKSPVVTAIHDNEVPVTSNDLFQNINNIDLHTKDTFRLKGALGTFLGDLEIYKLAMSIEGDQGAGKTQLAFQLADGFADIGFEVGMFQLEIGANSNIIRKNRDKYLQPSNRSRIQIAGEAPDGINTVRQYAEKFGVIIIDSWTKLDVDSQEFDNLRNDFPNTVWIVLFQRTSGNKIRGGTKPLYDAGINIDVVKADESFVNNYAITTKNRYGQSYKYNISSKKIIN